MKKPIFLLIAVLFFIIFPMVFICRGVNWSEDLSEVETQIERLKKENNLLEKEFVQKKSSSKIFSEAVIRGYEEATVALKR